MKTHLSNFKENTVGCAALRIAIQDTAYKRYYSIQFTTLLSFFTIYLLSLSAGCYCWFKCLTTKRKYFHSKSEHPLELLYIEVFVITRFRSLSLSFCFSHFFRARVQFSSIYLFSFFKYGENIEVSSLPNLIFFYKFQWMQNVWHFILN